MLVQGTHPPETTASRVGAFLRATRIGAYFLGGPSLKPAKPLSDRMPDLEKWAMPHRSVDMADWENAYNMAKNPMVPDRSRLLDLYDSIMVDAHLASVVESRVLRVARSKFKLVGKDGKPKPELIAVFRQRWFADFLRIVAEAKFYGHTLVELGDLVKPGELKDVTRIDPRNVLPYNGIVVKRFGDTTGYKFREEPLSNYVIEVGRMDDLGLLSQVAPVAIFKKYAAGSWSDYVEKFAVPARWVKTNSTDKKRIDQLEENMVNMISSSWTILRGDEEFGIVPTPGVDAHQVFDKLIQRMNSEMSKRILGQDGTTDSKDTKGTYGSLQILQGVAEDRHQSDKADIGYLVNNQLFPRLIKLGYKLEGVCFEWDELSDLSPKDFVDAVGTLGQLYDINPQHIEERTGIKIDGVRRMPGEAAGGDTKNPLGNGRQGGAKKGKKDVLPEDDDDEDGATASWPSPHIQVCARCGGTNIVADALPTIAQSVVDQLLADVHGGATWSQDYFEAVSKPLSDGLLSNFDLDHLSYDQPDHVARVAMETNLFRFGGVKTLAAVSDLNAFARESTGFADFKRRVDESGLMGNYNRKWFEAEYVNAVNTGMQSSRWYQMQRSADVLPFGEYYTQGDAQVRPAHAVLHGKKWPMTDPIWARIWPPNGWKCRCTVLPTQEGPEGEELKQQSAEAMDGLVITGELERMKKGGFDTNRSITGEVFKLNTAYRDQLGSDASKKLRFNVRDAYGRADMDLGNIYNRNLPRPPVGNANAEAAQRWFDGHSKDGVLVCKDAAGRPWMLEKSTVVEHLTNSKYSGNERFGSLHLVPDIIAAPDEVWLTSKGGTDARYTFLKYYEGKPMVVKAQLVEDKLRVSSWFELNPSKADAHRTGLLLKKMPGDT